MGDNILRSLATDFFSPASRGQLVLRGIGMESPQSFLHLISRIFAYATQFFIVVGFYALLIKRKESADHEYLAILSLSMALLIMSIVLPNFAISLQMTRLYHILLVFLAPLCVLGGEFFFKSILKSKTEFSVLPLILIILIPFFLFQTNFIFEVTGDDSWSIAFSKYRMDSLKLYYLGFVDGREVYGVKWLSKNMDLENVTIYTDVTARALTSYGMVPLSKMDELTNTTTVIDNGIIYLGRVNTIEGFILGRRATVWNITDFSYILEDMHIRARIEDMNKVYSNGVGEIHKNVHNYGLSNITGLTGV